jgi:hypothetical protein
VQLLVGRLIIPADLVWAISYGSSSFWIVRFVIQAAGVGPAWIMQDLLHEILESILTIT